MEKITILLIFGLIFVMIDAISVSNEFKDSKNRRHATIFGLRKIRGSSNSQNKAAIRSGLSAQRFKRQEEDAAPDAPDAPVGDITTAAPSSQSEPSLGAEATTESTVEEAAKSPESATGEPAGSEIGSAVQTAIKEASENTSQALAQDGLSVGAPINVKMDIEDIILSSVKLVVDIAKTAHNATSQITGGIANKALEIKGNVDRTVQNVGGSIFGTALNMTQSLAEKIGFGRIIPGVLELGKK